MWGLENKKLSGRLSRWSEKFVLVGGVWIGFQVTIVPNLSSQLLLGFVKKGSRGYNIKLIFLDKVSPPIRETLITNNWHERAVFQRSGFGRSTAGNDIVAIIIISLFFFFPRFFSRFLRPDLGVHPFQDPVGH